MTFVTLPNINKQGKANEWSHVEGNDVALQTVLNGQIDNTNIAAGANIARSKLEGGAQGIAGQGYTPSVIATEQTRENVAFGTLPTVDEITGVVVPANGKLLINYRAHFKSSVANAGVVALFIGANQVKGIGGTALVEVKTEGTGFLVVSTTTEGLSRAGITEAADATTGQVIGPALEVFLNAGTYTVSAQYKATSGTVTAKERKLWVEVHGF